MSFISTMISSSSDVSSRRSAGITLIAYGLLVLTAYIFGLISVAKWQAMENAWIALMSAGSALLTATTVDQYSSYRYSGKVQPEAPPSGQGGLKDGEVDA